MKKAEIRQMMADIDKEVAATVLFDEVHSARLAGEPPPPTLP